MNQNSSNNSSDMFFLVESFKIFFEKVLNVINDPKGIAIQEWMKYKDLLSSKEFTPQSIYSYSNSLAIETSAGNHGMNIVKLKKQAAKQGDSNTPRKLIGRRNSIASESPSERNASNGSVKKTEQGFENYIEHYTNPTSNNNNNNLINPSNNNKNGYVTSLQNTNEHPSQFATAAAAAGIISVKKIQPSNQQQSQQQQQQQQQQKPNNYTQSNPNQWNFSQGTTAGTSEAAYASAENRKRQESPTKRVNPNEIQQLKGLSEVGQLASKGGSRQVEMYANSQKLLIGQIRACIAQFKKDSTGLDLIHDRSFQTQTMLIDNKRAPYDRTAKRQDSKFIRELSVYTKKGPPQQQQQQQQQVQQQQPQNIQVNNNNNNHTNAATPIIDPESYKIEYQKNNFIQQQQQNINSYQTGQAQQAQQQQQAHAQQIGQPSTTQQPQYSGQQQQQHAYISLQNYAQPSIVGMTDYIKINQNKYPGAAGVLGQGTYTTSTATGQQSAQQQQPLHSQQQQQQNQQQPSSFAGLYSSSNNSSNPTSGQQITSSLPSYIPNPAPFKMNPTNYQPLESSSQSQSQQQNHMLQSTPAQPQQLSSTSRQDIDSLVQRILSEQKAKDAFLQQHQQQQHSAQQNPISTAGAFSIGSVQSKERMVQDIINKQQQQQQQQSPAIAQFSPQVPMKQQNSNGSNQHNQPINSSPFTLGSTNNPGLSPSPYKINSSPLKSKDPQIGSGNVQHYQPYTTPPPSNLSNKM